MANAGIVVSPASITAPIIAAVNTAANPNIIVGNKIVSVNETISKDILITGNLTVNPGITFTVTGNLRVYGAIVNQGDIFCDNLETNSLDNADGLTNVFRNAFVSTDIQLTSPALTGSLIISGNLFAGGNIAINGGPAPSLTIQGSLQHCANLSISGAGVQVDIGGSAIIIDTLSIDAGNVFVCISGLHCQSITNNGILTVIGGIFSTNPIAGVGATNNLPYVMR